MNPSIVNSYLDEFLELHLYFFDSDEIETHFENIEKYKINEQGKFIKQ